MSTIAPDSFAQPPKRSKKPLLVFGIITGLAGAAYAALAAMSATSPDPSAAAAPPIGTPAALPAPPAPVPPELSERLDAMQVSIKDLSAQITTSADKQSAMQTDVAAIKAYYEKQEAAAQAAAARAKRAAVVQRKPSAAQQQSTVAPVVLSVDTWDGKPSAVLRGLDGRLHFASTGDRIPFGTVGAIQAATQTVVIQYDDGSVATLAGRRAP
jgi:hypothetical protein